MTSIVSTSATHSASTAAWYPDPVPISRTRSPGFGWISSVIQATTNGCEIVCPAPIGSGPSS